MAWWGCEVYHSTQDTCLILKCRPYTGALCLMSCVQIPFGIQGIDRGDCDGDECDPTIDTDFGAPIWDENILEISNE